MIDFQIRRWTPDGECLCFTHATMLAGQGVQITEEIVVPSEQDMREDTCYRCLGGTYVTGTEVRCPKCHESFVKVICKSHYWLLLHCEECGHESPIRMTRTEVMELWK